MDKEKQIKEMAADIRLNMQIQPNPKEHPSHQLARLMFEDGYRKQREGKWIKATPYSQEYCNQCGLTPKTIFGKLPPFCPHCGAKMK